MRLDVRLALWTATSVVAGAVVGALINLATSGGHGWLIVAGAGLAVLSQVGIEVSKISLRHGGLTRTQWLRDLRDRVDNTAWMMRRIDLRCRGADLDTALKDWVLNSHSRLLLLTGDFGSGKTWAMRRLARNLAVRLLHKHGSAPVPLVFSLGQVARHRPQDRAALFRLAWPQGIDVNILHSGKTRVLALLDGLDELLNSSVSPEKIQQILSMIADSEPKTTRFIVACRGRSSTIDPAISDLLGPLVHGDDLDRSEESVRFGLGKREHMHIEPVSPTDADHYLNATSSREAWANVQSEPAYRALADLPFTLYMLAEALPQLQRSSSAGVDLAELYSTTVGIWLVRAGLSRVDQDTARGRLELLATTHLFEPPPEDPIDQRLVSAGVITAAGGGWQEFRHYSLAEFYLAQAFANELKTMSGRLLGRLDLVAAYTVNRFLVPDLVAETRERGRAAAPTLVSYRQFRKFCKATGWRRRGYGRWRTMAGFDGTIPYAAEYSFKPAVAFDGPPGLNDQRFRSNDAITGISWYDAWQYTRWAGGRLPTAQEAATIDADLESPIYEWTASWYDERAGLTEIVCPGPETLRAGLNPDLRLLNLGFRVIGEARAE